MIYKKRLFSVLIIVYLFSLKTACFGNFFDSFLENNSINNRENSWDTPQELYVKSRFIDDNTWNQASPCFFPDDHPIKKQLDLLFTQGRISTNIETLKAAGFQIIGRRSSDKAIVARHPLLKGYIIKLYLDDQIGINDHYFLFNRLIGAAITRHAIHTYGYQKYFIVPQKWLYPLPDDPDALLGLHRKNFVVIAEELNIVSDKKNTEYFKKKMTKDMLQALYIMISLHGLSDAVFIKNIPFTDSGQIAFVDTERFHLWNIKYNYLTPHLSSKMQKEWKLLTGSK